MIKYAIRRILRYAKYAAVGAVVAALGGTLLGTLGSGIAFFAAPSLGVGMGIGVITAIAKVSKGPRVRIFKPKRQADMQFGWRHRGNHFRGGAFERMKKRAHEGRDGGADEAMDAKEDEARLKQRYKAREDVWMRS